MLDHMIDQMLDYVLDQLLNHVLVQHNHKSCNLSITFSTKEVAKQWPKFQGKKQAFIGHN